MEGDSTVISAYGLTVSVRAVSSNEKVTKTELKKMVCEALGKVSNDDRPLNTVTVSRGDCKMQFIKNPDLLTPSYIKFRQNPSRVCRMKQVGKFQDHGGDFEKCTDFIGHFLVHVEEDTYHSSDDGQPTAVPVHEVPLVAERKKELYKSLFDDEDPEPPACSEKKARLRKVSERNSKKQRTLETSKSSRTEKESKSSGHLGRKLASNQQRPITQLSRRSNDEAYVPSGKAPLTTLTYTPSSFSSNNSRDEPKSEYVPEYVPSKSTRPKKVSNGSAEYVPSRLDGLTEKSEYVPVRIDPREYITKAGSIAALD